MKLKRILHSAVCLFIVFIMAIPITALSQDAAGTPSATLTKEELAQMLAPIALYPDPLLAQVLMASTYPLEVIEADRWIKQNLDLKDSSLDEALKGKDWDPSIKSLCYFPTVLSMMSDHITQMTRLGNAFLAQQKDVMDMIQTLRAAAQEQGNLKSTPEENVVDENGAISIEPSNPEVIYVPEYNPLYVYGSWLYPAYPPYFWGPGPIGGWISFYPGFFVGVDIGSWCFFDWPNFVVFIDFDRRHRFHRDRDHRDRDRNHRDRDRDHREHDKRSGKVAWHHDPDHRRGVAYMDKLSAQKFGQSPSMTRETRRNFRGFSERLQTEKQTTESIQRELGRGPAPRGKTRGAERRVNEIRGPRVERGGAKVTVIRRGNAPDNAFNRSNEGREELRSSERGRTSRESFRSSSGNISAPRGNTGGSRGGSPPRNSGTPRSSGGGSGDRGMRGR